MNNNTRPAPAGPGGALPADAAFFYGHPPCAAFSTTVVDRINSHGYRVATSRAFRKRRAFRDAFWRALDLRRPLTTD